MPVYVVAVTVYVVTVTVYVVTVTVYVVAVTVQAGTFLPLTQVYVIRDLLTLKSPN